MMETRRFTPQEQDFGRFFPEASQLQACLVVIRSCRTLREVEDRVVVPMIRRGLVTHEQVTRKAFYGRLLPLLSHLRKVSPTTLYNHMVTLVRTLDRQEKRLTDAVRSHLTDEVVLRCPGSAETMTLTLQVSVVRSADGKTLRLSTRVADIDVRTTRQNRYVLCLHPSAAPAPAPFSKCA
ncbi:MAG: hypothetical protein ACI36X_07555 [Bacteroidaceae bacterium]